jgi:hypothetical protein
MIITCMREADHDSRITQHRSDSNAWLAPTQRCASTSCSMSPQHCKPCRHLLKSRGCPTHGSAGACVYAAVQLQAHALPHHDACAHTCAVRHKLPSDAKAVALCRFCYAIRRHAPVNRNELCRMPKQLLVRARRAYQGGVRVTVPVLLQASRPVFGNHDPLSARLTLTNVQCTSWGVTSCCFCIPPSVHCGRGSMPDSTSPHPTPGCPLSF